MKHRIPSNGLRMKRKRSPEYEPGKPVYLVGVEPTPVPPPVEKMAVREVHVLAMVALKHFAANGDSTSMSTLVLSLVTPVWRKALIKWYEKYARIRWNRGRNQFKGGPPKEGIHLLAAEQEPFRKIPKYETTEPVGVRVDILWSMPYEMLRPCRVCGRRSISGEDTCYGHHNK